MNLNKATLICLLSALFMFAGQKKAEACHAIALVNFTQQTIGATSIFVNAASDSPTCGCDVYWLDCEVRCLNEPFDAAPFAPGFHGPLATYPYFQSADMTKNNCVVQNYPGITIPFANLCPGMTYQYRMRENHHGQVGPWCAVQTFTVPGATQPIVAGANASQTTICAGDCVNLTSSVVQGCGLAAAYNWDNGLGAGQNQNVCPNVTTTYTVTIDEQCSGFQDQASVTVNVVPPPVVGVANISATNICAGTPITVDVAGQQGTIQWQSAPGAGGPWTNIAGETNPTYTDPNPQASTCYRAEITGCAPPPAGIQQLYSNVVCVTVDPAPTADFTYVPACPGTNTTFTDNSNGNGNAITNWDWDFDGDGNIDDTNQNPSVMLPGAGPWNVTLTVTIGTGCTHTVTLPVNPAPGPTANFNYVPGCPGAPTNFTDATAVGGGAVITGYDWDFDGDGNTDATTANPNYSFPTSGNHNVTLTVTTNGGCSNTITLPVTIPELPVASFTMQNVCDGVVGNFNDASVVGGGAAITNWDWDMDNDGNVDYTTQNVAHTYPTNNTYTVQLTVTSDAGCVDDTIQNVQIYPNPVADFTSNVVCAGLATDFTDQTNTNGATMGTWDWDMDGDGNPDVTGANPSYTFPAAGNYNVTLVPTTTNGCTHSVTLPVTVEAQPTADFNFVNACDGQAINYTDASAPNGSMITTWEWDFDGDGNIDDMTANPSNTFPSENVYNTVLIITSATGCKDTIDYNVNVYPNPVADFTPQSVCLNVPVNFADASTVSNTNTANNITGWAWDYDGNPGTDNTNQNPPTQTYTVAGQYNISLTVTTDNGCTNTLTVPIDIFDKPVADFSFTDDCVNLAANFNDLTVVGGGGVINDWSWDFDGDGVEDDNVANPSYNYPNAGTYNVTLIAGSGSGCSDTVTHTITRYPMPTAIFSVADECVYDSVCYNDMSVVQAPDVINSHIWTFGDGSPLNAAQSPCHKFSTEGQYNTCLIVTSNNGCVDDTCVNVTVHPKPSVSFTASSVCENEPPTVFTNTSNISSGVISQWNWTFEAGGVPSSLENPTYQYGAAGTHNPVLIGISDFGCSDTATIPVDVYAVPVPIVSADVTEGCPDLCVQFGADQSVSNAGAITAWEWNLGNGNTAAINNPTTCYGNLSNLTDAQYSVQLIVTNNLGCSDTVLMNNFITVHPNPIADFTATPPTTNEYDANIAFTNSSLGADSYFWNFGDMATSAETDPEHWYNDIGDYDVWLYAYTQFGCVDSTNMIIPITPVPSVYVPNAFTPDADGVNDMFTPVLYGWENAEYEFYVFDRWGQIVFESFSPGEGWDGGINGIQVDSKTDVFVWKLILRSGDSGDKKEYVGHVTLLR